MDFPKISVIVPFYNNETTLKRCILSILDQKYSNIELLLIDDGSTDHSLSICEKFKMSDSRVQIFTQKKLGVSAARNLGLEHAVGDYVCFSDADDEYTPDSFQTISNLIVNNNVDMIIGGFNERIGSASRNVTLFGNCKSTEMILEGEEINSLRRWVVDRNEDFSNKKGISRKFRIGSPWAKAIKREVIKDSLFNTSLGLSEDLLFIYQMLLNVQSVLISNEIMYTYYINGNSVTQSKFSSSAIKNNSELSKALMSIRNDYDISFEQFIYKKIVNCYWNAILKGLPMRTSFFAGAKVIKKISSDSSYISSFKNIEIMHLKLNKELILTILFRLHLYGFIFFIRCYFYGRNN